MSVAAPAAQNLKRKAIDPAGATDVAKKPAHAVANGPFPLAWWMPLVVFFSALALRVINTGSVRYAFDDSVIHIPTAGNYVLFGFLGPDNWFTQPGAHYVNWVLMHVFGNDPLGWRQALAGAVAVLLTFLLAREVFRTPFVAVSSTILVALDPTSLGFSRTSLQDVLVSALVLGVILEFVRALRSDRTADWVAVGLLLGAAGAARWYALLVVVPMALAAFWMRRSDARKLAHRFLVYVVLTPVAIYILAYVPWLMRGYGLSEWLSMQAEAIRVQALPSADFFAQTELAPLAGPRRWFVGWVGRAMTGVRTGTYSVLMNDPVLWWTFLPATAYVLWRAVPRKAVGPTMVGGTFVVLYAFFALTARPIFLYSSLTLVPLGFMALSYVAERFLRTKAWYALGVAGAWSLYLFPLTCALPVPEGAYLWLLNILTVRT
jgi:dolichyl-phosphate-mannose--protein O-mannosyl transferase